MPVEKFSISFDPSIAGEIERREGARSTVINECLERYFWLVAAERRNLRRLLSDSETALIVDVLNATIFADRFSVASLAHEVADGIELDRLDAKWEVDGKELVAKLENLSYGALLVLIDAVKLWWNRHSAGSNPSLTTSEVFAANLESKLGGNRNDLD